MYELVTTYTWQHKDTGNDLPKMYNSKFTKGHESIPTDGYIPYLCGRIHDQEAYAKVRCVKNFVAKALSTKRSRCRGVGNFATCNKKNSMVNGAQ